MSNGQNNGTLKYLVAPTNYNVSNDVSIIEVDTSSGLPTVIFLQQIIVSEIRRPFFINDVSNNAAIGNIVIMPTGGNLINNAPFLVLSKNGISAQITISDRNRFIANLNTDDGTTPIPPIQDKNFVMQQSVAATTWSVPHNLNKRCAIQVLDNSFNEIIGKVHWVNDNECEVTFNTPKTGYVYCN